MAKLAVKNLAQYGVVVDIAPFEAPINAWTDSNNVNFELGGVVKASNRVKVLTPANDTVNKFYTKNDRLFYTTKNKIYFHTGASSVDVSNGTFLETPEWYITELSGVLIFSNEQNIPVYFDKSALITKKLQGWAADWRSPILRSYKNFLIALRTSESGQPFNQRVRWSDITAPNQPPTDWDATSTTNSAGFNDLTGAKGNIIDGLRMGDSFVIYTDKEVFMMNYVGGNDIFQFNKVLENTSLLAPECACEIEGGHFVVTTNDVIIHNGHTSQSIITDKIKTPLFEVISSGRASAVKVINFPAKKEVWICYPSYDNTILDRAAVYNTTNSTWTYRDLPNVTALHYGILPDITSPIIDNVDVIIDDYEGTIDGLGKDFIKSSLITATNTNEWYAMDEGGSSNGQILPSSVTKMYMDFDDAGIEATQIKQIKRIYPQIQGDGKISITVGKSDSPYEPPKWGNPKIFDIQKDYMIM